MWLKKYHTELFLIDKGKVIADGSFGELKEASKDENLEKMFTRLTGNTGQSEKAGAFINTFEN